MKIKGVTTGKNGGNPIEYSPAEKAPLAVKDAVIASAPKDYQCWAEEIKIDTFHHSPKAVPSGKKFANNVYSAEGEAKIRELFVIRDEYYPAKSKKFKIEFEDSLDNLGQPDLKVNKFEYIE